MADLLEVDSIIEQVANEVVEAGATGAVLVGSHARGTATEHSDIDLYAIGEGPEYAVSRRAGWLVTVSWRTAEVIRKSFVTPPGCVLAVPAWRSARIVRDPEGVAIELCREAAAWDWGLVEEPGRWCALEMAGFAEEAQKLRGALERGDDVSAAIWRNVIAMRMAPVLAVRLRLLLDREEDTWPAVAEAMGAKWAAVQRRALGLDGASMGDSCQAALELLRLATAALAEELTASETGVLLAALG